MAKKKQKTIAIVHYNTPELTLALIASIRKHTKEDYRIVIFDNSDEKPFPKRQKGVKIYDNTKGQIINWEEFLAVFPNRCTSIGVSGNCNFGSSKHMASVQKLMELIGEPFILMDSDILITNNFDSLWDEKYAVVGHRQLHQRGNRADIPRLLPMLCFLNAPRLLENGAKYFDAKRSYGLLPGGMINRYNWYDTGAPILEDVIRIKPALTGRLVDIRDYMIHYMSGSWKANKTVDQHEWLEMNADLWQ